jgi:hypothetical protein
MGRYLTPLAVLIVVAAVVIIVTSGESIAVRYLVGLVSLDVAVRLVRWERGHQEGRSDNWAEGPATWPAPRLLSRWVATAWPR